VLSNYFFFSFCQLMLEVGGTNLLPEKALHVSLLC